MSSGTLKSLLDAIAVIFSVIAIPLALTVFATYNNKLKAKGKKGLVNLFKTIPFLLLFVAIILLFVVDSTRAVHIILSMVIGAIVFPTAIWMILSLYHKLAGKKA